MGTIDDFLREIEQDELNDKAESVTHLTPIEYARLRGMAPQTVYYALRNHRDRIQAVNCQCGRRVLEITVADSYFGFEKEAEKEDDEDREA